MRTSVFFLLLLPAAAAVAPAQTPGTPRPDAPADAVTRWNGAALAAVRADRTPPPVAARNLAALHVAVYDAVALADGRYRPLRATARARPGTDPRAAAAAAAHRVLTGLYPARVRESDAVLAAALDRVPDGPAKDQGVALGKAVAGQVLEWRAEDVRPPRGDYAPRKALGRWEPTPPGRRPPLLPGWGKIPCFAAGDPAAFRPPPPPDLTTDEYAAAYREVKALGGATSTARTKDQTEVAHFWADGEGTVTPPGHWNRIALAVADARELPLAERARLFAVLNVAMADAAVVCWGCKYGFDFWRPVTAIRTADAAWTPLLPTPPFPSYTSGHSSFSGAAAAALAAFFGTDDIALSTTSDDLPGVTRSFKGFSAAAAEAGMSRIYGGIHWGFDNTAGLACGKEIAEHVARHAFRPAAGRAAFPAGLTPRDE